MKITAIGYNQKCYVFDGDIECLSGGIKVLDGKVGPVYNSNACSNNIPFTWSLVYNFAMSMQSSK